MLRSSQLGLGDCAVRLQPHKLNGLLNADVKVISAGHKHTLCVTDGIAKKVRDLPEYQEFFDLLHSEGMLVYDALKKAMEDKGLNSEVSSEERSGSKELCDEF